MEAEVRELRGLVVAMLEDGAEAVVTQFMALAQKYTIKK